MKWEYIVESLPIGDTSEFAKALNKMGRQGWEVATMEIRQSDGTQDPEAVVVFKRQY